MERIQFVLTHVQTHIVMGKYGDSCTFSWILLDYDDGV